MEFLNNRWGGRLARLWGAVGNNSASDEQIVQRLQLTVAPSNQSHG